MRLLPFLKVVSLFVFLAAEGLAQSPKPKPKQPQPLDPFFLHEIRIRIEEVNWEARLSKYKKEGKKDEIICAVWLNGVRVDSVGIRYKGNSSYNSLQGQGGRKLPFSLDAKAFRKQGRFPGGISELKLANGFRDPSLMREVLAYYIARSYMPAPRSAFARVVINDEYFGVYAVTEEVDKVFLQNSLGESQGPLFKCDPDWSAPRDSSCPLSDKSNLEYVGDDPACYKPFYELKNGKDWAPLMQLTQRLSDSSYPLDSLLDVDRALWMHAFNNVLVNLDSYSGRLCHNYFLYQDRSERFLPLVWDMNLAFGGFRMVLADNLSDEDLVALPPLLHAGESKRPLIRRLLADSLNRKVYLSHMRTILTDYFQKGQYKDLMAAWSKMLSPAVQEETMGLYGFEAFTTNRLTTVQAGKIQVIGLQELMDKRAAYLLAHPELGGSKPSCAMHKALKIKDKIQIESQWYKADKVYLIWRQKGGPAFGKLTMTRSKPVGKGGVVPFRASVPWIKGGIEFYMIGENVQCATVYPKASGRKPLKAG